MKKLIVVADWVDDSLTCQEVRTAVEGFLKDPSMPNISFTSSTPSTIHTGYIINQIVAVEERYGRPLETIIFQNTDPRIQSEARVEKAQGAEFVVMRLKSGMYVMGPNAGYNHSFIKSDIDELFIYKGLNKGSQFRSRDLYPRVAAHIMDSLEDELELEEISLNEIPEVEGYYVGHIDNYGNIKTTLTHEDLKGRYEYGEKIKIKIGAVQQEATFVDNLFGHKPGELVIYPGSSGKKDNPYIEITIWRHFTSHERSTGVHAFNDPLPGAKIEIMGK